MRIFKVKNENIKKSHSDDRRVAHGFNRGKIKRGTHFLSIFIYTLRSLRLCVKKINAEGVKKMREKTPIIHRNIPTIHSLFSLVIFLPTFDV